MNSNRADQPSRERFIAAVSRALGRTGPPSQPPQPPEIDASLVRLAGAEDDLPRLFAERAGEVGMEVRRCAVDGLAAALAALLAEIGARSVTIAIDRLPEHESLIQHLSDGGVRLAEWRGDRKMDAHYEVDAGITDVHAALAETGSLICCADAAHGRGHSLVPAVHIAIVRASDIVPDMVDYMARLKGTAPGAPGDLPSAQAIITGPSKTADIEGVLITGVHGPGRVLILLVEDG